VLDGKIEITRGPFALALAHLHRPHRVPGQSVANHPRRLRARGRDQLRTVCPRALHRTSAKVGATSNEPNRTPEAPLANELNFAHTGSFLRRESMVVDRPFGFL